MITAAAPVALSLRGINRLPTKWTAQTAEGFTLIRKACTIAVTPQAVDHGPPVCLQDRLELTFAFDEIVLTNTLKKQKEAIRFPAVRNEM